MAVGHNGHDVEFVDLSGQLRTCNKPAAFPDNVDWGQVGAFFDGSPIVCGGYENDPANEFRSVCYRYDYRVTFTNYISCSIELKRYV